MTEQPIVDPEFQALIPPLSNAERQQLEANVLADGCRDPIVTWNTDAGQIVLDGHTRIEICERHGLTFTTAAVDLPDRDAARAWIIRNQFGRRNLTPFQRVELALRLEPLIASRSQQGRRADLSPTLAKSERLDTREELAGLAGLSHGTIDKGKLIAEHADADVKDKLRRGEVTIHAAFQDVSKQLSRAKRQADNAARAAAVPAVCDRWQLICGDLAEVGVQIEGESVDWIVTDPPYPREYLPVYDTLAAFAARVLKPGGSLICMAGQSYLLDVAQRLARHLTYNWACAYLTPGEHVQQHNRRVMTGWKPLLWFTKGPYKGQWLYDVFKSESNDKRFHGWGQSESGIADIVERFTRPGDLICDPFVGGGSTAVVAVQLERRFVGIDIDPTAIETTKARLAGLPVALPCEH